MSAAEAADLRQVLEGFEMDIEDDNHGNNAIENEDFAADCNFHRRQMNGAIAKEYGTDNEVHIKNTLLKLPLDPNTGAQLCSHNQFWQGDDFKSKPVDDYAIKGRYQPSFFKEKGPDDTEYEGNCFWMMWEIPVVEEGSANVDLSNRKPRSQTAKLKRLNSMMGV